MLNICSKSSNLSVNDISSRFIYIFKPEKKANRNAQLLFGERGTQSQLE